MNQNKSSPTLISLRFFAAYGLLFLNVAPAVLFVGLAAFPSPFVRMITWGFAAIPFAYCLAGFLLLRAYGDRFPGNKIFWKQAFAWIAPVYFLSLLLSLPALLPGGLHIFAGNLFFLGAWAPALLGPNPLFGPVSAVVFFLLLFPFLLPLFASASKKTAWILLALSFFLSFLPAVLVDSQLLALMGVWPDFLYRLGLSPLDFFIKNPLLHLGEFTFGMALARLYAVADCGAKTSAGKSDLLLLAGLLAVPLLAILGCRIPDAYVAGFAFLPIFALQLWGGSGPRTRGLRFLEWRLFVLLGESAYALALMHWPMFAFALWVKNSYSVNANPLWILLALLIGSGPVAVVLHLFFERPLREKLK